MMQCKKACLVINPRGGHNLEKITDMLAVLSAAGWQTDIALKEYPRHAMLLATRAAEEDYDMVVGYGGDGTLNQVINGIMNAKGQHSIFGALPGGTANEWATEAGIPLDPVKAALSLVDSEVRKVDIGHVEVEGLTFPNAAQDGQQTNGKKAKKKGKASPKAKHHFLLMAGLGIDAAVMEGVSKPLKYRVGPLAVGVAAAKKLPEQHPFPVEVRVSGDQSDAGILWKGEALQVVIGNTRRYADVVEMTPDAYIDDGILDLCLITAGNPLTTAQQIMSLLLRRKPDNQASEYFRGPHLTISVPVSIGLQLDGSTVKLKDYLSKAERKALEKAEDLEQVMVSYRLDAVPHALRAAIPRSYHNTLFEKDEQKDESEAVMQHQDKAKEEQHLEEHAEQHNGHKEHTEKAQGELLDHIKTVMEHGRKVIVVGVGPTQVKKHTYHIIAGSAQKQSTGEIRPVAVRVDEGTTVVNYEGEHVLPDALHQLKEGDTITVDGDKSKRGVIQATHVVV